MNCGRWPKYAFDITYCSSYRHTTFKCNSPLASFVFELTDGMSRQTDKQSDGAKHYAHSCAMHLGVIIFPLIPRLRNLRTAVYWRRGDDSVAD